MKRFTALLVIFPLLILVLSAGCERRTEDKTPESTAPVAEKQPEPEQPAKAVPESAKEAAEAVKKLPVSEFPSFADLAVIGCKLADIHAHHFVAEASSMPVCLASCTKINFEEIA